MSLASALAAFRNLRLVGHCSKLPEVHVQPRRWRMKENDRRYLISSSPIKEAGTMGENMLPVDTQIRSESDLFPDANTANRIFNGIPFCEVPICHIRVSKNNTIYNITSAEGVVIQYRSCGQEGFRNARKGTTTAAQSTAVAVAKMAMTKGVHTVRIKIEGLGPGRMTSVKALQLAGLKIISVTDSTHVSWNPPRSKKQRRL